MNKAKKHLVLLMSFITLAITGTVSAADLVVQESGPVGTYASIGAAVAASTDGDRIIINNTVSGFPWTEDILINKSLSFLSAADNQKFVVQGEYTIQHAPGREITIIGMENVDGGISSISNGGTTRTIVNIMWCDLADGNVNLNHDYFELNLASSTFQNGGDVSFKYGKVIGNQFSTNSNILLSTDALAGIDSVHIVGNTGVSNINCTSSSHYLYVSNNSISINSYVTGINITNLKDGTGTNVVRNNSIKVSGLCIQVSSGVGGRLLIYNNILVDFANADYGIDINSVSLSNLIVSYNFVDNSFDNGTLTGFTNDGTNTISGFVTLNTDGSSAWIGTIDGGNPGTADYDLDLTRNDPGCLVVHIRIQTSSLLMEQARKSSTYKCLPKFWSVDQIQLQVILLTDNQSIIH